MKKQTVTNTRRPLYARCRVDELPAYGTDNDMKKAAWEEARSNGTSYDRACAAIIRKHLRQRFPECKFSVTSGGSCYLDAVNITIKASPYGRELVKGDPQADNYRLQRDHWENSAELEAVLTYCKALHNAFDADDGDHFADYGAHHDLYGQSEIDFQYQQTAQTPETVADVDDFRRQKAAQEAIEEAARLERWAREKAEREEAQELERIAEEKRRRDCAEAEAAATVEDLPEGQQIAMTAMIGGLGKESTEEEARQDALTRLDPVSIVVSRRVTFPDAESYRKFSGHLLVDFSFLSGFGGTSTEDIRITSPVTLEALDADQLSTVSVYLTNCVAVYIGDDLQMVVDPEGYDYARYCYFPTDATTTRPASDFLDEQRRISEGKDPFYLPEPIARQIDSAHLTPGDTISVLNLDPFSGFVSLTVGRLEELKPIQYAQCRDAGSLSIKPVGKREPKMIIFYGHRTAVFRGSIPDLPDSLKYSGTFIQGETVLRRVNFAGSDFGDFLKNAVKWYISNGYTPIIDTIRR